MFKKIKEEWILSKYLESEEGEGTALKIDRVFSRNPSLAEEAQKLEQIKGGLNTLGEVDPPPILNASIMKKVNEEKPRSLIYTFLFRPRLVLLRTSVASMITVSVLLFMVFVVMLKFFHSQERAEVDIAALSMEKKSPGPFVEEAESPPDATMPSGEEELKSVKFFIRLPSAGDVRLVGDFNNWSEDGIALDDSDNDGNWMVEVKLEPGKYQYMFFVDDREWVRDKQAAAYVDDGFGDYNSLCYVM